MDRGSGNTTEEGGEEDSPHKVGRYDPFAHLGDTYDSDSDGLRETPL